MRRVIPFLVVVVVLLPSLNAQRRFEQNFVGDWVTVDSAGPAATRILIDRSGDGFRIQAWGRCHPRDCDWGTTELHLIGSDIRDDHPTRAIATWNHGFATMHMVIRVVWHSLAASSETSLEPPRLLVEKYTIFTDGSGRKNYRMVGVFTRR